MQSFKPELPSKKNSAFQLVGQIVIYLSVFWEAILLNHDYHENLFFPYKKKSAECPSYKQLFYNIVYYLIYLKTYSFDEAIWFPVTFYKLLLFLHSCFWE